MTGVCVRFLTSRSWAAVGLVSGFLSKALFRKSLKSLDLKYTKPLNIRPRGGCNRLLCNGDKTTIDSQSYSRNVKEILLCFSTFLIVVRMFGHITIYKVTHLKVHSKEKKNPFSRTTTVGEMDRLDYKGVFMHLWHHKDNPAYWNSTGWRGGRLVELCTLHNRNPVLVFTYHCISDGNRLSSEHVGCYFHFILRVMSDKAAFVSGALLCVQRYRWNLAFSDSASCWKIINLHIYGHKQCKSVGLWYK